jgi:hypothetical protein
VTKMTWKTEPDPHDYPAAASYLSLIITPDHVNDLIDQLKTAPLSHYKARPKTCSAPPGYSYSRQTTPT